VIATPSALRFIDQPALEAQTGAPVRSEYKEPGSPDVLPPAAAIVVGGASFNTINKWAAGICDTLALGLLTEGIGLGLPLAALPFLNAAQAAHPAFGRSVKELREAGAKVLLGSEGYEPHVPHQGFKIPLQIPVVFGFRNGGDQSNVAWLGWVRHVAISKAYLAYGPSLRCGDPSSDGIMILVQRRSANLSGT
jgi:hypothetical protein